MFCLAAKLSEPRKAMKAPCTNKRSRSSKQWQNGRKVRCYAAMLSKPCLWRRGFLILTPTGSDDQELHDDLHKANAQAN